MNDDLLKALGVGFLLIVTVAIVLFFADALLKINDTNTMLRNNKFRCTLVSDGISTGGFR